VSLPNKQHVLQVRGQAEVCQTKPAQGHMKGEKKCPKTKAEVDKNKTKKLQFPPPS